MSIAVTGCSTAQLQQMKDERNQKLQKQYPSFNACFNDEKILAVAGGAIIGGLLGKAVGGSGGKGNTVAALGAVLGGIIGNRIAWQSCLDAFAVKAQTVVVNDRASALSTAGAPATQAAVKSLTIQAVDAGPLVFGRDIEFDVTYRYISDNPATRDIKVRVTRSLQFKGPDGSVHEVPSVTEDTIQQGVIRSKFAIPTPSLQDAEELKTTTDWTFKFTVEVDGLRDEKAVNLVVTQASSNAASGTVGQAVKPAPTGNPKAPDAINLKKGTALYSALSSTKIVMRLRSAQSVKVLQRSDQGKVVWTNVRLSDGKEGWIKEVKK